MTNVARTIVATGCSSGLGFEAIKQLLTSSRSHKIILGARDTQRTETAFNAVKYDNAKHQLSILPLQLSSLKSVKSFAQETLATLGGPGKIDCLLLNAATSMGTDKTPTNASGSKWSEAYIVNHLSQHYLIHLLLPATTISRIVFVSSGAIRQVTDTSTLLNDMLATSNLSGMEMYPKSKFVQLLNAHWWRRQLQDKCRVIAVSPGLIPGTGLGRDAGFEMPLDMPDAKSVAEGGANVLRAVEIEEFPEDREQIFLTSWGEWWGKDVYEKSLNKVLQDAVSPGKEEIEREEGLL